MSGKYEWKPICVNCELADGMCPFGENTPKNKIVVICDKLIPIKDVSQITSMEEGTERRMWEEWGMTDEEIKYVKNQKELEDNYVQSIEYWLSYYDMVNPITHLTEDRSYKFKPIKHLKRMSKDQNGDYMYKYRFSGGIDPKMLNIVEKAHKVIEAKKKKHYNKLELGEVIEDKEECNHIFIMTRWCSACGTKTHQFACPKSGCNNSVNDQEIFRCKKCHLLIYKNCVEVPETDPLYHKYKFKKEVPKLPETSGVPTIDWKKADIVKYCEAHNLPTYGNKADLIERIKNEV